MPTQAFPVAAPRRPILSALVVLFGLLLGACDTATPGGQTPTTGSLQVSVSGANPADVTVSGPDGFQRALTASSTLDGLVPGTYEVTADQVTDGDRSYGATVTGSPATVEAGKSATATVQYVYLDPTAVGSLQFVIDGLPAGAGGNVTVSGPDGFSQAVAASTTLVDLVPGYYSVVGADVDVEGGTYQATVDESEPLVLPDETAAVTVTYGRSAPEDADSSIAPALYVQFRPTSGAPLSTDQPQFNAEPWDVKGVRYVNAISNPGDDADYLTFDLTGGESASQTIEVTFDCGAVSADASPIRATLTDPDGTRLRVMTCGNPPYRIGIPTDGTMDGYLVAIEPTFPNEIYYVEYELSIDAFCTGECVYTPFVP